MPASFKYDRVDILLIGYLFGKESDIKNKTEMIILITPRVIASLEDIDLVTEEFQNKVSNISFGGLL